MPGFTRFHPLAFTRYCLIHRHFKSWVKQVKGNCLIVACKGTISSYDYKLYENHGRISIFLLYTNLGQSHRFPVMYHPSCLQLNIAGFDRSKVN